MRNKILFLLSLVRAYFLDSILLETCPWVYFGKQISKFDVCSRDQDTGDKCERQCEIEYLDCTSACSNSNCLLECGRALSSCNDGKFSVNKIRILNLKCRLSMSCKLPKWLCRLSKPDLCLRRKCFDSKQRQFGNLHQGKKHWLGSVYHWLQEWPCLWKFVCWFIQSRVWSLPVSGEQLSISIISSIFY